ncbi:MAG: choice-of-anchor J domain-containing protein [Prevotellaceae bacterium]|nr:choice-of-anchor J domain-containing protein [Prevotellaceae bacterium]
MKKLILLCTAAIMASAANAQITYLATDFTDGIPSTFTLHDEDGRTPSTDMQNLGFAVGTPWITVEEGKEGNRVACSTSWYKNAGQSDDWMITDAITIDSEKAVLSWRSRASDKDYRDGFTVYVSETGTDVADFDKTTNLYTTSKENYDWTEHTVSLSAYAGKTIYIAFVNDSKDKTCLYVDDLFVGVPSNVGLTTNLKRVINEYGEITVSGKAMNTGDNEISGFTIGYDIDGQKYEQEFSETIEAGKSVDFTLNTPFTVNRNQTSRYNVWIKSGNDSTGTSGNISAYPWKLVSEEVTGTWCGYCVRGIVAMKTMNEKYPDSFIGIAIHNSDPMAYGVEDYHDALFSSCSISGYPHSVYNRNPMYSIDPGNMEYYYLMIKEEGENNTGIELKAEYNEVTGEINSTADVYFAEDITNADYKLAYVIIENNVHGEESGYMQTNYYANNAYGEMGGFESLPEYVPADQMWYNDVARGIYPSYSGESGIIPSTVNEGDQYSHNYTLSIPSNVLVKENTELAVLLLDKNGIIVNADKVEIDGLTTGIYSPSINKDTNEDDAYYTISGVRVNKPSKGIYIHNGKKIAY